MADHSMVSSLFQRSPGNLNSNRKDVGLSERNNNKTIRIALKMLQNQRRTQNKKLFGAEAQLDFDFFDLAQISAIPSVVSDSRPRHHLSVQQSEPKSSGSSLRNKGHTRSTDTLKGTEKATVTHVQSLFSGDIGTNEEVIPGPSIYEKLEELQKELIDSEADLKPTKQEKTKNASSSLHSNLKGNSSIGNSPKKVFIKLSDFDCENPSRDSRVFGGQSAKKREDTDVICQQGLSPIFRVDQDQKSSGFEKVIRHQKEQSATSSERSPWSVVRGTKEATFQRNDGVYREASLATVGAQRKAALLSEIMGLDQKIQAMKTPLNSQKRNSVPNEKSKRTHSPKEEIIHKNLKIIQDNGMVSASKYRPLTSLSKQLFSAKKIKKEEAREKSPLSKNSMRHWSHAKAEDRSSTASLDKKGQASFAMATAVANRSSTKQNGRQKVKSAEEIEEEKREEEEAQKREKEKLLRSFSASMALRKSKMFLFSKENCLILDKKDPKYQKLKFNSVHSRPNPEKFWRNGLPLLQAGSLIERNTVWDEIHSKKIKEKLQEKENGLLKPCTFKPELSKSRESLNLSSRTKHCSPNIQNPPGTVRPGLQPTQKSYFSLFSTRQTNLKGDCGSVLSNKPPLFFK